MYEILIIWETGEKETHKTETLERAKEIINNYKMAFGNQIQYVAYTYRMFY